MDDQMGNVDIVGVPIVDTSGRRLRLITSPTSHEAVASTRVATSAGVLHLDVLAASHRVLLQPMPVGSTAPVPLVSETVACELDTDVPPFLPATHSWRAEAHLATFSSSLQAGAAALDDAVATLATLDPTRSLVARFPGHRQAFTAIEVTHTGAQPAWRTWHLYPGADPHVVVTATQVAPTQLVPASRPAQLQEVT